MKRLFSIITFFVIFMFSCQTAPVVEVTESKSPAAERTTQENPEAERVRETDPPPEVVEEKNTPSETVEEKTADPVTDTEIAVRIQEEPQEENPIDRLISGMTLDEKIGQLFIIAVKHTSYGNPALEVDDYIRDYIKKYKPGGVILFSLNFQNPAQTRNFIAGLQEISSYPLFICTDEEGGMVSRLGKSHHMNVLSLPPARVLGKLADPELTEQASRILGYDMKALGFNMNMAPVADISPWGNVDVIGSRSFSSDPFLAGTMTASAVRGFKKAGISSVLKHFPGHGNVGGDSHSGAVSSLSSRSEFYSIDFKPFQMGINAGSDFVMMGHIAAPALTGNNSPASLSRQIQTGILREELGFDGLIISDAMDMGAIKKNFSAAEAALMAFNAGSDIILMPENIPQAIDSIKSAVNNGTISTTRLNESLNRILKTKLKNGLFANNDNNNPEILTNKRYEEKEQIARQLNSLQ